MCDIEVIRLLYYLPLEKEKRESWMLTPFSMQKLVCEFNIEFYLIISREWNIKNKPFEFLLFLLCASCVLWISIGIIVKLVMLIVNL